jgi:RNA polymerase sigma factor (sigma-70 family)
MSRRPFEEIIAEHGRAVMRVCRALVDRDDAEDAWAETFLAAMRAYPRLRPQSNVRGWLVTIAHRKALDQLRGEARRPELRSELPEIVVPDETPDTDALRAALDTLAPKQRGAVVYRHLADLPYDEVGRQLGCSAIAARRNAADGIAKLRRQLEEGKRR